MLTIEHYYHNHNSLDYHFAVLQSISICTEINKETHRDNNVNNIRPNMKETPEYVVHLIPEATSTKACVLLNHSV